MTELGFAYLFMSDGHLAGGKTPTLCLYNLSHEPITTLNEDLNEMFGLAGVVGSHGKYLNIKYEQPADVAFFRTLGQKYYLPPFSYKIPSLRK